jgi:hypothetical protein
MLSVSRSCAIAGRRPAVSVVHYAEVSASEVIVGSHAGSGHTDFAGACSHAEFLGGHLQDVVRAEHGEAVLAEMIEAVRRASRA